MKRCPLRAGPSHANPVRAGDAKPGIFPREDRPVAGVQRRDATILRCAVKAKLMRIAVAVSLLATMVLSLAAGLKW